MNISNAAVRILDQLRDAVLQISDEDFCRPSQALSKSTLGQHLRHTLEFFICFEEGLEAGNVNYDKRGHDHVIETDREVALAVIERVREFVNGLDLEKEITLDVGYNADDEITVRMKTNAARELVYNIEHAVHHMAIMKIGIREVAPHVSLGADFGIAASTIRFRQSAISNPNGVHE